MKTVLVNYMDDDLRYLITDLAAPGEEDATEYTSASQEAAQIHDCSNVNLPALSPNIQRRYIFTYGEKDFDLKRERQVLPNVYPRATLTIWKGYDHCERLTNDSAAYGQMPRELVV